MDNYLLIGSILLIHLFAWFTPGPNFLLIVRNSLVYSRRTGLFTAVGIALSNVIHISLAIAGIGLLITTVPLAQHAIKFIGVGYLLYLGIKTFFMPPQTKTIAVGEKHHDMTPLSAMKTGFITNMFSPKAPLFFGSIFGTLLSSEAPLWVIVFLLIAMPLNSLIMASLWSIFLSHHHVRKAYVQFQSLINKSLGITLLLVAFMVAFSKT